MRLPVSLPLQLPSYVRLSLPWSLSLFWRSFGLLIILIFIGFALWARGMALRQEYPRAQALAGQLAIGVNLTRSALMHTKPANRAPLLLELNHNERVDVFIREATDTIMPLENTGLNLWLRTLLQDRLGKDTLLASEVNGITGLWISFDMEGNTLGLNTYWLRVDAERMDAHIQNDSLWWLWLVFALLVSPIGAAWMTQRIADPLSALAKRTQALSEGLPYEALPTSRVKEIAQVNAGMNRMAAALENQEAERRLMLAGLSHDLRTPLARLRLELEFAPLNIEQRAAMTSDIAQIDAQLKQFTDYVGSDYAQLAQLDLTELIHTVAERYARDSRCILTLSLAESIVTPTTLTTPALPLFIYGDAILITRLLTNLIENACRYGAQPNTPAHITVSAHTDITINAIVLQVKDQGTGVDANQLDNLLQPFVRGDIARSGSDGSGLGLAIVARIAKRHAAKLTLKSEIGKGFEIQIQFPSTPYSAHKI